ncbi:MAG: TRAP transporter substrate-binding protein DctP [Brooklawnia sp.]|nr:TRAP transporter substrate-binding protein DctP [Brooklawnia sp.]
MVSRRTLLTLPVPVALGAALASCGGSSTAPSGGEGGGSTPITLQAGYENNPGEPIDLAMNKWSELLAEKSGGTMRMDIYPSSQLGSKKDLIDQMIAGSPVITLADGAFYADMGVPDFGIVFGPFLFDTWDDAWRLTQSDWYAEQSALLENQGVRILTSKWKYGDRHLLINRSIDSVDGLKGLKVRVPNNLIQIKGFEAMGATPTPMALGEVYTALQTGTIDGLENPLPVLYNGRFQEVAKYLILTGHVRNFTTWITGTATFNALSDEQKQWLTETGDEAGVFNNEKQDLVFDETLQKMKDEGVTVLDLDINEFKQKAQSFYSMDEVTKNWTPGLYDTVRAAMK